MDEERTQREGFVLPAAILGLVVVGALVVGGVLTASQEHRIGMSARASESAFYAAEQGIQDVLGSKDIEFFQDSIPRDSFITIGPREIIVGGRESRYTVNVHRLATRLFMIASEGETLDGGQYAGAKRRAGLFVRTGYLGVPRTQALQTKGTFDIKGNSQVHGTDTVPSGWADCDNIGEVAGLRIPDDSMVSNAGKAKIHGTPAVQEDPLMDQNDFFNYGDMEYDDLAQRADKVYPGPDVTVNNTVPAELDGACDTTVKSNWGDPHDPLGACHEYFPIIHAQGDMTYSGGGYGQGILVVDGDLHISGGSEFYGIVIVKGRLTTSGSGNKVMGTVLVWDDQTLDVKTSGSTGVGKSHMQFSSCAIERAYRKNNKLSRAFPLHTRSWADLAAVGMLKM